MKRTIKKATDKRYYYEDEQLRRHLYLFMNTYDRARQLKPLRGLTSGLKESCQ